jgi:hypothetical protein
MTYCTVGGAVNLKASLLPATLKLLYRTHGGIGLWQESSGSLAAVRLCSGLKWCWQQMTGYLVKLFHKIVGVVSWVEYGSDASSFQTFMGLKIFKLL